MPVANTSSERQKLISALANKGVRWGAWKNFDKIYDTKTIDFDIFVAEESLNAYREVMREQSWIELVSNVASFPNIYHFYKLSQGCMNHLHVYTRIRTGDSQLKEYLFPSPNLSNPFWLSNHVPCINQEDARDLNIIRTVIKRSTLIGDYLYRKDSAKYSSDYIHLHKTQCESLSSYKEIIGEDEVVASEFAATLNFDAISSRDRSRLTLIKSKWKKYRVVKTPIIFLRIKTLLIRLANKVLRGRKRLVTKHGLVVAICGPDGVGKTSIATHLSEGLNSTVSTRYIHIGRPLSNFFHLRKNSKSVRKKSASRRDKKILFILKVEARKTLLIVIRCLVATWAKYLSNRGTIVICDRWLSLQPGTPDSINKVSSNNPIAKTLINLQMRLLQSHPQADLALILHTDLDTVLYRNAARKQPESEELVKERFRLSQDIKIKAKNVLHIINNNSLEDAIDQCHNQIIKQTYRV